MPEYNTKVIEYNGYTEIKHYKKPINLLSKEQKEQRKEFREELKNKPLLNSDMIYNPFTDEWEVRNKNVLVDAPDVPDYVLSEREKHSVESSYKRTKQSIYSVVRANTWEYFVTLTFNREKVVASDYDEVRRHINSFLTYARTLAPDLKYIFIPELHKDGKNYHIHGLVADIGNLQLIDSGVVQNGKKIYNLAQYKKGFSTFSEIVELDKTCSYITKYVTKDLCTLAKGKRRFWASKNINKPKELKFMLDDENDVESLINSYGVVEYAKTLNLMYADCGEMLVFNKCKIYNVESE